MYHATSTILDSFPTHNALLLLCTKTNHPTKTIPPPPKTRVSKGYPFSCPVTPVLTKTKQLAFFRAVFTKPNYSTRTSSQDKEEGYTLL